MAIVEQISLSKTEWNPNFSSKEPIPNNYITHAVNSQEVDTTKYMSYEMPYIVEDDQPDELVSMSKIPTPKYNGLRRIQTKKAINILNMNQPRNETLDIWNRDNLAYVGNSKNLWSNGFLENAKEQFEEFGEQFTSQAKTLVDNFVDNIAADFFGPPKLNGSSLLSNNVDGIPMSNEPIEHLWKTYLSSERTVFIMNDDGSGTWETADGGTDYSRLVHFYKKGSIKVSPLRENRNDGVSWADITTTANGDSNYSDNYVPIKDDDNFLKHIDAFSDENRRSSHTISNYYNTFFTRYKMSSSDHRWIPKGDESYNSYLNPIIGKKPDEVVVNHPKAVKSNSSPWEMIHLTGPDFLKHKFDAFFMWNYIDEKSETLENSINTSDWITDYEKYILSKKGFAVRVGQITIPNAINDEFEISFAETTIKKIKSTKTINKQSSFTFRLDQNLIWLDKLNELSGHKHSVDETILMQEKKHPYTLDVEDEFVDGKYDCKALIKTIAKTWPTYIGNSYNIKDSELCLIVKMVHLSNWINPHYQLRSLPYFVFENVRILGTSDAINYEREGDGIQEVTINFIYKRCHQIMPNIQTIYKDTSPADEFELTTNSTIKGDTDFGEFYANGHTMIGLPIIPTLLDITDWTTKDPNTFEPNLPDTETTT